MGAVTAFPARVPAPITAFMLAFIELVPPLVVPALMPAWDLPAGHVGVNFDVGVGVNFGVGVVGVAGGRGGGGGDAFFIVRALVARSFNSSEIFAQRIERRPSRTFGSRGSRDS